MNITHCMVIPTHFLMSDSILVSAPLFCSTVTFKTPLLSRLQQVGQFSGAVDSKVKSLQSLAEISPSKRIKELLTLNLDPLAMRDTSNSRKLDRTNLRTISDKRSKSCARLTLNWK